VANPKRVLFIAYYYPPQPVAGARRAAFLGRYLQDYGWSCTVLTRFGNNNEAKRTPVVVAPEPLWFSRDYAELDPRRFGSSLSAIYPKTRAPWVQRILNSVKNTIYFPDKAIAWFPNAFRASVRLHRERPFDAIISTAMPATSHLVACAVARVFSLPWLADYRDPWTGNPYATSGALRRTLDTTIERGALSRASALTTVNKSCADILENLHNRTVKTIPNTYDPADWASVTNENPQHFALCFTGSLQGGLRSPELIFRAVARLRSSMDPAGNAVIFHFYGADSYLVRETATRFGLEDRTSCHGLVDRESSLRAQRDAAALLILLWRDGSTADEMGSKIYEYLGAGRPILAVGPPSSNLKDFLETTGAGWYAYDEDGCVRALQLAFKHFQSRSSNGSRLLPRYTARNMAKDFSDILDRISERAKP
jgi:hypothetical protein